MFPAEVHRGNPLPSCFSCHSISKYPFQGLFSGMFFKFCGFVGDLLTKMASEA